MSEFTQNEAFVYGQQFKQMVDHMPDADHPKEQLDNVDTQLAQSIGALRMGKPLRILYPSPVQHGLVESLPVNQEMIGGMSRISKTLRRGRS